MLKTQKTKRSKQAVDLVLEGASELLTLANLPNRPRRGRELGEIGIIPGGSVAIRGAEIVGTGSAAEIRSRFSAKRYIRVSGKTVLPGFVDSHTHPVFATTRELEFEQRILGKSYLEIAASGGGILSSVEGVRAAGLKNLTKSVRQRLDRFLSLGTTTLEGKSGYGLSTEDEIRSLRALKAASRHHAVEVVPTFLGAHEFPAEYRTNHAAYLKILTEQMLPRVRKQNLAEFCDVFCEKGVFELEESRKLLEKARALGFKLRLHADELFPLGGAELAVQLKAFSADHLVQISKQGIQSLKDSQTIAILLPGTSFFLRLEKDAPAREMIESGVAVALATDFNPGSCYTQSMPMILNLASVRLRMTPAEGITAATLNAAFSLGRGERVGSLHPGKQADLIICDIPNYRHLSYEFGRNPVQCVIKKGKIVYGKVD